MQIRGYQKVDFELNQSNSTISRNGVKTFNENDKECKALFIEQNHEEWNSQLQQTQSIRTKEEFKTSQNFPSRRKKMTLKDIYEEFWEFIADNNEIFHEFIINDKRRNNSLRNSNLNEVHNYMELGQEI
jgi:hypothetical protein